MRTDQLEQVEVLFHAALEQPARARAEWLRDARDDSTIVRHVERMLAEHDTLGGFMEPNAGVRSEVGASGIVPGARVGAYTIVRVIGQGGMGAVYEAVQDRPRRTVALKMMRPGVVSPELLRRFDHESQILAHLRHPWIAQVYEAGAHGDGPSAVPYFAMELIPDARVLTDYAVQNRLTTRQRLELFVQVCEAVHHGHQSGVIHRDIKPANILIDGAGRPKVIDFGVARATDLDVAATMQTDARQIVGTLRYMSPEQFEADSHAVDTRSDVYSLGVVLYELLCGQPPYDLPTTSLYGAARIIREQSPRPPSAIQRALRGDLETILFTALEKDRQRRYASAAELARDIQRCLNREPIAARPPTLAYQLVKLISRHRAASAIALAAAVSLVVFAALVTWQWRTALAARKQADDYSLRLAEELRAGNIERGRTLALACSVDTAEELLWREHLRRPGSPDSHWALWELYARDPCVATLGPHGSMVDSLALAPDGRTLAVGVRDGTIHLWEYLTREQMRAWPAHAAGPVKYPTAPRLAFTEDGMTLVSGGYDGVVRLWDVARGACRASFSTEGGPIRAVALLHDADSIATGHADEVVRLWELSSGTLRAALTGDCPIVNSIALGSDGRLLAATTDGACTFVWDVALQQRVFSLPAEHGGRRGLAFSPPLELLAIGMDRGIELRDTRTWEQVRWLEDGDGALACVFSPDGRMLATATGAGVVRLWDAPSGRLLRSLRGHHYSVSSLVFSSGELLSGSHDGTVRVWDLEPDRARVVVDQQARPYWRSAGLTAEQNLVAAHSGPRCVKVWRLPGWEAVAEFRRDADFNKGLAITPDGRTVAAADMQWGLTLWDVASAAPRRISDAHQHWVDGLVFTADGKRLISSSHDKTIRVWDVPAAQCLATLTGHTDPVYDIALSPDGRTLASASYDGDVRLWDVVSGTGLATLSGHSLHVLAVTFDPTGRLLASAGHDGVVIVWDVASRVNLARLAGHAQTIDALAFHPAGEMLASGSRDYTIRLWHVPTRRELAKLDEPQRTYSLHFCRNGQSLLSGGDSAVAVWDLTYFDRHIAGNRAYQTAVQPAQAPMPR